MLKLNGGFNPKEIDQLGISQNRYMSLGVSSEEIGGVLFM